MTDAPLPIDDPARVAALRALAILDTPREERFDRLTRLAQAMIGAPIAIVSLVDADRQWFKSCVGLDVGCTARGVSFCGHAILQDGIFEVPDALADPRFATNPLVVGEPHIRFYAGQPLVTPDGHRVGTLCVIDRRPRTLDARERAALRDLAAIAADELAKVEIARALRRAEAGSQAKSEFLANMSHELRTPLNAIIGYAELLIEDAAVLDAPGFVDDLARIRQAGDHLLGTIGQVLDLAKLEAGGMEAGAEPIVLPALARALAEAAGPLASAHGNRLAVRLAPDLPTLWADPALVRKAAANLLANACRFTAGGEVTLDVRVEGGQAIFEVRDTGRGIAPEALERLFDAFTQADGSATRAVGGIGLGLTLARRFARLLDGDVTARSRLGHGSIFTLHVPLGEPPAAPAPAGAPAAMETVGGGRRVVLAIDDDPVVRDLLTRQLRRECYEVVTAASGPEGLALARALKPAAITLDMMMPGMDGLEVLATIKADPELADIPVIVLTMTEARAASRTLGAAAFVPKPLDRVRLATAIAEAMAQRSA